MKIAEVAGTPVTLYHLTPASNLGRIMRDGLVPKIGRRSRRLGEPVAAIYLFNSVQDAEDAFFQWYGEQFSEMARIALLAVTVPVNATEITGAGYERVLTSPVPPNNIRVLHKDVGSLISLTGLQ